MSGESKNQHMMVDAPARIGADVSARKTTNWPQMKEFLSSSWVYDYVGDVSMLKAEELRLEAEAAKLEAEAVELEAKAAKLEAEAGGLEAKAAKREADNFRAEAGEVRAKAAVVKSDVVKLKAEADKREAEVKARVAKPKAAVVRVEAIRVNADTAEGELAANKASSAYNFGVAWYKEGENKNDKGAIPCYENARKFFGQAEAHTTSPLVKETCACQQLLCVRKELSLAEALSLPAVRRESVGCLWSLSNKHSKVLGVKDWLVLAKEGLSLWGKIEAMGKALLSLLAKVKPVYIGGKGVCFPPGTLDLNSEYGFTAVCPQRFSEGSMARVIVKTGGVVTTGDESKLRETHIVDKVGMAIDTHSVSPDAKQLSPQVEPSMLNSI